ncbi:GNAT family N-acetyltransferase [Albidovulum sp.]|uniref:GNAT family N-acetyltransferase n=1 Tax=Albidovulum sp. TaxID=1872424 RepID=UPI0039B98F99
MTGVRPYRAADRPAVAGVFYRAVHQGAAARYDDAQRRAWAPSPEPDRDEPDKLLSQWCWVAEDGRGIIGFMSLAPSGYLDMAFVLPEVMGKGVADALYAALISRARAEGLGLLTVRASHLARSFFERHGWHLDAADNLEADGQVYETFLMSLDLRQS